MKKIWSLMLLGLIFIATAVTSAFAYFTFTEPVTLENITTGADNAKFDETESDFYKVYFFASPYYATGATIDGEEITDPLKIADSGSKNPYNQDNEYGLIGGKVSDDFANAIFPNTKDKYYISAESIDSSKLGTYGAIKFWPQKYWSGYILANPNYGIYERTSTYVSLTVNANIPADVLSDIIAQTVFKDQYGFGPEFIGWTYDMEACNNRVRYNGKRYKSGGMNRIDSRGHGVNGSNDQIGNYGFQGSIEQISSSTSLYYIDNMGSTNSQIASIDGSLKGDHVIYLYPVFTAKNYDANKCIGGVATTLAKFRINPEVDVNGQYTYQTKQSGEINYAEKRYTVALFQNETSNINEPNYFTNDMYFDTSGNSEIKNIQLDMDPENGSSSWASYWATALNYDDLKALNLPSGYYSIFMSLWIADPTGDKETIQTQNIKKVIESFENSNKYVKITSSKREDGITPGIDWMPINSATDKNKKAVCYVIGFQKSDDYRITGNSLNGSINNFESAKRKKLYRASVNSDDKEYFFSDSLSLNHNDEFSILVENTTTATVPYSFSEMDADTLNIYNNALTASNHSNKTPFVSVGSGKNISLVTTNGKNNKMVCNKAGIYAIMVAIEYKDGVASNISVSYRELDASYFIFILKSKPTDDTFFNSEALETSNDFLAMGSFSLYSSIIDTIVLKGKSSEGLTIKQIHEAYPNMAFVDTATGWEIKYSLFESGKFILNRNYVIYLNPNS